MSTTVDNRVVKMTFDNTQFEKAIKNTIKTIEEFEKKLDMKGAAAGFNKVGEAADKLNLSGLSSKAEGIRNKFNEMSQKIIDGFSGISGSADKVDLSGIGRSANNTMTEVQQAISGLDADSISTEMNQASEGFDAFSVVAIGALAAVGQEIENFLSGGLRKIVGGIGDLGNKVLWKPMMDGFKEYETQIGSIQTIMANTGRDFHSGEAIAEVNAQLDKLNEYADKTIYNFTEMTRNIGTFTAAGISMEDAVPAIQGIANMAAMSGSTSQQASTAMYQLSQALSAGTVKLQDWNSVVNAGMGGQLFRDKLLDTAYHIHSANGEMEQYGMTLDQVRDGTMSFRDSLKQEWITSEVLTEALQQMTYSKEDMTEAEQRAATAKLEALGYTEEEIEQIFKLGQAATESATKVRTWSQLWDTVGEAMGSGWTTTWRTILGDFEDATNLFTYLSDQITGVVGTISDARNAVVEGWAAFGGRDFLFGIWEDDPDGGLPILKMNGALQNFVDMLKGWAEPVSAAFEDIFDFFNDDFLVDDKLYDADFAAALREGGDAVIEYRKQYLDQFEEGTDEYTKAIERLKATEQMVEQGKVDPKSYNADFARVLKEGGDAVEEYRAKYLEQFEKDTEDYQAAIEELDRTEEMFNQKMFDNFDPKTMLWDSVGQGLATVTEGFNNLVASLIPSQEMMAGIYNIAKTVFSLLETGGTIIGSLISIITGGITFIRIFLDPIIDFIFTVIGSVGRVITTIAGYVTDLVNALMDFGDRIFGWIIPAVKGFVDGFLEILGISEKVSGFTDVIIGLMDIIWDVLDIPGKIVAAADMVRGAIDWIATALGLINDETGENAKTWDNLGERIVNSFNNIKQTIIDTVPFLGDIIKWFENIFSMFKSGDTGPIKEFIHTHLTALKDNLMKILKPIADVGSAIFDFVVRTVKSFGELEIVKDVQKAFSDFGKAVSDTIGKLPRIFELFGTVVGGVFSSIGSALNPQGIVDYFSNLTPQKALDDIVNFGNNIKDNFNGMIDYLNNTSPKQMGIDFFEKTTDDLLYFYDTIDAGSKILKQMFPEYAQQIDKGTRWIIDTLDEGYENIYNIIKPAFDESQTFPELIFNIFRRIGIAIKDGIANIKISDIFNFITSPFRKIIEWLEVNCPSLSKYLTPIREAFDNLSKSLDDSGMTIGDVVTKAFETIQNVIRDHAPWLADMMENISKSVGSLPNVVLKAVGGITGVLSGIPGPVGETFGNLSKTINDFTSTTEEEANKMPGTFEQMFDGVEKPAEEAGDSVDGLMSKFDPSNIPGSITSIGSEIIKRLGEELDKIKEYLKTLPGKIDEIAKELTGENGVLKQITDRIRELVEVGLTGAIATFVANLGFTFRNLSKALKGKYTNDLSEKIRNLGIAIAAVGGVIYILGKMELGQIIQGSVVVVGIAVLLGALTRFGKKLSTLDKQASKSFKRGTDGIKDCANAILEIGILIAVLGLIPWPSISIGSAVVIGISVLLGGLAYLSTKMDDVKTEGFKKGAKGLKNAATAILEVGILLAVISLIPPEQIWPAFGVLAAMAGLMVALDALMRAVSNIPTKDINGVSSNLQKAAQAMILLGIAVAIMSYGFSLIQNIKTETMAAIATSIAAIIGLFIGLTAVTEDVDVTATAAAMIALGASVAIMAYGFSLLDGMKWEPILAAAGGIAVIMLAFMGIVGITKETDMIATASAMVIFGAAVAIMCASLTIVANMQWEKMIGAAFAIAILVGAFGLLAHFTKETDLIATSVSLVIFGVAVAAMCAGLSLLINMPIEKMIASAVAIGILLIALGGMTHLTKETDLVATAVSLTIFGAGVAAMAYGLAQLAALDIMNIGVAAGVIAALIAVIAGVTVLLAAIPEINVFASVILPLLAMAITSVGLSCFLMGQGISVMVDAFLRLVSAYAQIEQFFQMIGNNSENIGATAMAFGALGGSLVVLSVGMAAFGAAGMTASAGISALTWALNGFLDVANRVQEFNDAGHNITAGIGDGISGGMDVVTQAILGIGQGILQTVLSFFGIHSPSDLMADEVGQYIPEGIAEGIDLNSESMMGSLGDNLGGLVDKFTTWVNEEGLPKLQEFGNGLLDKLKNEILPQIENWVTTEGIPALQRAAHTVVDKVFKKLDEAKERAKEWASGIPDRFITAIKNKIHEDWNRFLEIGGDIIKGIVDGITQAPRAIADAVIGMANNGLQGIKDFFGIASPSKVMRDEVGRWIPAGLAEGINQYAKLAVLEGSNMAQDVSDGINNSIKVVNPDIDFGISTITPVLDMSGVDSAMSNYNKQWSGVDFNAMNNNIQNIDASLDLTPMLNSTLDQSNQLSNLQNQNGELLNAILGLRSEIAEYNNILQNTAIVMDSGLLVGALAPGMDSELGRRQSMARRGVIR